MIGNIVIVIQTIDMMEQTLPCWDYTGRTGAYDMSGGTILERKAKSL